MRKWMIGLVVLLVVVAAAVALALANLNRFLNQNKGWVASKIEEALGRKVTFDEVGVQVFGGFGARVKNLSIADDPAFSEGAFVHAGNVQVAMRLLPALFGRFEVKSIELLDPEVTIVRDAKGFNFDSIGKPTAGTPERPAEAPAPPKREEPAAAEAAAFVVALLEIQGGSVHYVDRTPHDRADMTIRDLDFTASDVSFDRPIEFQIAAALFGADRDNFSLAGKIGPLGAPPDVKAAPLEADLELDPLDVEALRKSLPAAAKQIPPGLGLSGPVELSAHLAGSLARLQVSKLSLDAAVFGAPKPNLSVRGSLGPLGAAVPPAELVLATTVKLGPVVIDNLKKLPALAQALPPELSSSDPVSLEASLGGSPENLKVDASFDAGDAALRYGSSFVKPKGIPLALALGATRSGTTLHIGKLTLRLAELELHGSGTVTTGTPSTVDLHVESNRAPLSGWDRILPALEGHEVAGSFEAKLDVRGPAGGGTLPEIRGNVVLADVSAKRSGSPYEIDGLSTKIDFRGDSAVLPATRFQLGGSPVELSADVQSFRNLAASYALTSPSLRLASVGAAGPGVKQDEVIRGLDARGSFRKSGANPEFRGTIRSSDGVLRDFVYQGLGADFALQDQIATLSKLGFRAFGGSYDGKGRYDMRNAERPKFDFQSVIRGMALKELLASQRPGAEKHIDGSLEADLAVSGNGKQWEAMKETLLGQGRVEVKNGMLKDVNIAEGVLSGVTGVAGLSNLISPRVRAKHPELFATGDTKFDKLGGTVQIANGAARTDDLTLAARDYSILGKGTFDFDNQLDFTATLLGSRELTSDIVADVKEAQYVTDDAGHLAIPFRLTG
ncbi:MAG: hypothetical protein QOD06_297, partial [Candidatus Binatota bacterium]|nr:hypothetical protein [Candidatus Binatota bacterium]